MDPKKKSVLIIDDDKFFLEFYRAELTQHNLSVEVAMDGEEGLEKALELLPDIIMLDIILPKKDGFEVVSELKSNKSTKNIPVITTSTLANSSDTDKLLRLGVVKNFNKASILPKDIASFVDDILTNGVERNKAEAVEKQSVELSPEAVSVSEEQAKQIFSESLKEVARSLANLFNSKIKEDNFCVSFMPFSECKDKAAAIDTGAGTVQVYSEIQSKKGGLVFVSLMRDDTLTIIEAIEEGFIGKSLMAAKSDKVAETFFNIILAAFLSRPSQIFPGSMLSKMPVETSAEEIPTSINRIFNFSKSSKAIFIRADYVIESLSIKFSFYAIFDAEILQA